MADYRIVFFDEVDDPYKITLMFQLSLFFQALPTVLRYRRENDDRFTPEFGIFAVTKDDVVAGGHLLMRISTQTVDGRLDVGGVNAVGTRPDYGRQGIMTAIMNRTHEYFREIGLEYSLLTSSWRLGAMKMYGQLDYLDLGPAPNWGMAVKYPNQPRTPAPEDVQVRAFTEADLDSVDAVFKEAVQGSYGTIHRPKQFLKARKFSGYEIKLEQLRVAQRGKTVMGYAQWDTNPRLSESIEIMALDPASLHALLAEVEGRNPDAATVLWCGGLTTREVGWLREAGYQGPFKAYGNVVMKSLSGKTDVRRLKQIYGVDRGLFRLGEWDST